MDKKSNMITRILLADDHKIIREGLRTLIEKQADMKVVAEAEDGRTTVRLANELQPDVVIMDISMPDLNGIEAARQVSSDCPGMKIVALSMHSDRRFVIEMFKAGSSGYMLKDCAFEELARAIREVTANRIYLSPSISDKVISDYIRNLPPEEESAFSALSHREREVLQVLAEGFSTKEIAAKLSVSTKTVETHRQNIMHKLGIFSVAELTKYAIREGLTSLEN